MGWRCVRLLGVLFSSFGAMWVSRSSSSVLFVALFETDSSLPLDRQANLLRVPRILHSGLRPSVSSTSSLGTRLLLPRHRRFLFSSSPRLEHHRPTNPSLASQPDERHRRYGSHVNDYPSQLIIGTRLPSVVAGVQEQEDRRRRVRLVESSSNLRSRKARDGS